MFRGSITALITPFKDGAVDENAFSRFVDWQITEGTKGLVPVGTTGESPTVSHAEHERVIEICVETTNKRVPVIAGAGSNSTEEAIGFAKFAQKVGADAILSVAPYYNKPNQEGLGSVGNWVCPCGRTGQPREARNTTRFNRFTV